MHTFNVIRLLFGCLTLIALVVPAISASPAATTSRRTTTYPGCDAQHENIVYKAINQGQSYASSAYNFIANNNGGSSRYNLWFGSYTQSRYASVVDNFEALSKNNFFAYNYDCSTCTRTDVYTYMNLLVPGVVYLCPPFFGAPLSGDVSQGGAILAQVAQFTSTGQLGLTNIFPTKLEAETLAAGVTDAAALAITNAANYQFFAENTNPTL